MHLTNKVNLHQIHQILKKENDFLKKLLSTVALPKRNNINTEDDLLENEETHKPHIYTDRKTVRAKSLKELEERLKNMTGKKKQSYKEKLAKKNLKNRVKRLNNNKKNVESKQKRAKIEEENENKSEDKNILFNSDNKMVFSKFDFKEIGTKKLNKKGDVKDPKKLLKIVGEQKSKLQKLEETSEIAELIKEKEKTTWKNALAKSEGKKVKDDEILLKKSVKKLEQKKRASKRKWDARIEKVQKTKDEKQKKRTENIDKRKKDKRLKQMKSASKRGKIIPVYSDGETINIYLNDESDAQDWSPTTSSAISVEVDPGYQIQVNVTDCNIDGESGDFAILKGENIEDTGFLITYTLGIGKSYFYNTEKVSVDYTSSNTQNILNMIFTRVGQPLTTTTTEISTSTIFLPTPSVNDSDSIQVFLYGKSLHKITQDDYLNLQIAIAEMSSEYCSYEGFPLNGSITITNVKIKDIYQCPITWKDFDQCIYITLAIPVALLLDEDSPWSGYQLNSQHLNVMWRSMASKYIPSTGFSLYPVPNVNLILKERIILLAVILLIFIAFLLVVRYIGTKYTKMRRRKLSDTVSIVSQNDYTNQLGLQPHYLQETPPLFENSFIFPPYHSDNHAFQDNFTGFSDDAFDYKTSANEDPQSTNQQFVIGTETEIESET